MTTMNTIMRAVLAAAMAILLTGCCGTSVNQSINVGDGEKRTGTLQSVNGSITLGRGCEVDGKCRTVNGGIRVGDDSTVGDLGTVNGGVTLGRDVTVNGDVDTVNGAVRCGRGAAVGGEISTVNGEIVLENTTVARDVRTHNGDILLRDQSRVGGDLVVEKSRGSNSFRRELRIEIGDGSVVEGDVVVRDDDIDVVLYLSGGGTVKGEVIGAKIAD